MPDHDRAPDFLTCPGVPELPAPTPLPVLPSTPEAPLLEEPIPPMPSPFALETAPPIHARSRTPLGIKVVGAIFLVFFLGIFCWFSYGVIRVGLVIQDVRTSLQAVQKNVTEAHFSDATIQLLEAKQSLELLRKRLAFFDGSREWPVIGADIRTLQDVATAGAQVVGGAEHLLVAAASFERSLQSLGLVQNTLAGVAPSRRFTDISVEEKRMLLQHLSNQLPELRLARESFAIASDSWTQSGHDARLLQLVPSAARFAEQLPSLKREADQAIAFLEVFLPLAGTDQSKNYLLLLQNADELRPTGGFIGTVGTVTINAATLMDLRFEDVYAIDNPVSGIWKDVPPEPLRRELGVSAWFFRDRNWSPDFPTSAEDLMQTYVREKALVSSSTQIQFDGVIALQPALFSRLLQFTGPIVVNGKTFSASTFFDQLQYDSEIGFLNQGIPIEKRKDIVLQVGTVLTARLLATPASRWGELLNLVNQSLQEKDVLLYVRDPKTLALLDARQWTDRIQGAPQDYLWVIDTNLAALKTDGVMEKEIIHSIDLNAAGGPLVTVTLKYRNTNRVIDWRHTRYRDYVRIYVPEGSELITSSGARQTNRAMPTGQTIPGTVDIMRDLGKTVFGAFWSIEPGETRTLQFTYRLPSALTDLMRQDRSYQLLVQKQPGNRTQLTLDHAFGKNIQTASPPEAADRFGDDRYQVSLPLTQDQSFVIRF